ncbi:hypothetical protein OAK75_00880 [Bacteriovoracales bacterium]|nr:hypothetical protein [Bacteriovoracales bacterium]
MSIEKVIRTFNFLHALLIMDGRAHLILEGKKGSALTETIHYQNVLKYIHQLPMRKGLVSKVEDYPYSGLFRSEVVPDLEINKDFLDWANRPHTVKQMGSIERGLKFKRFRFAGTRSMRRPPPLTQDNQRLI